MSDLEIDFDARADVLTLTLNRPGSANSLTWEMGRTIAETIETRGLDVGCILLRSTGSVFCGGVDLDAVIALADPSKKDEVRTNVYGFFQRMIRAIVSSPAPVVAVIQGPCMGVGADLALACDLRIASTAAWFEETWTKLGATSALGGGYFLHQLLGSGAALDLLLTARRVDAAEAHRLGIFQRLAEPDALAATAAELADRLGSADREAMRVTKELVRAQDRDGLEAYMEAALDLQVDLITRESFRERVEGIRRRIAAR